MTYFVEDFDTQDRRAVLVWARDDYDGGDSWAWCMGWLFDIAGAMYERDLDTSHLAYRPGAAGADVSEERREGLEELSDDALEWASRVLHRYDECLRKAGRGY